MNNFYVYEWIRLDTNEPFYVGKGHGNRWKELNRDYNPKFMNIVNRIDVAVNILQNGLTENEAFDFECYYIWLYRDDIGYDMCNICDGGEGVVTCGENNHFYGKKHTEETKQKISNIRKNKGIAKGENNPNYGKRGDLSPIKGRKHTQEELDKMIQNSKLRSPVRCIELDITFLSLTQAEKYMQEQYGIKIARRQLAKRLSGEIKTKWYGEITINGKLTKLHWEYI